MIKRLILVCLFLICGSLANAASFDCKKASTTIESIVCSKAELSSLDEKLGKLYSEIKSKNSEIQSEQKEWLVNVRGKCDTAVCLSSVYNNRISQLEGYKSCFGYVDRVVGHWVAVKNGFFEEFVLSNDGNTKKFGSWRNHRPEIFGDWTLNGCSLNIVGADASVNFDFIIKKVDKSKLQLINEDGEDEAYRR